MSAESANAENKVIFAAYRSAPPTRSRRTLLLAVAAVLALVLTWLVRPNAQVHPVVTKFGIKNLRDGMSFKDVGRMLGQPVRAAPSGEAGCFQYGKPSLTVESFTLYETCFENGKLVSVTEKQYTASPVDPDHLPSESATAESKGEAQPTPSAPAPAPAP